MDLPADDVSAILWLAEKVPELEPVLDIRDDEELLPYVELESDILGWFVRQIRGGTDLDAGKRFLGAIEELLTPEPASDERAGVINLVVVCVVHGLVFQGDDDVVAIARPWMGPHTVS